MTSDPTPALATSPQETNSPLDKRSRCSVGRQCIDNQSWNEHLAYLQELNRAESERRRLRMVGTGVGLDRQPDVVQLEFERMDGELDASVAFAAAGNDHYQNGALEFGDTALADAQECYRGVIASLYNSVLTGERRRHLDEKVNSVRQWLALLRNGRGSEVTVPSAASAV
jgi:hypothetical protein